MGDDARFWRYPLRERALLGGSLFLPGNNWDVAAMAAGDLFTQEIDPRGPDGWGGPLDTGDDYEKGWDRTGHAMAGLTRHLPGGARLTLQGNARYTHHREILAVDDPTLAYAQWLTAIVLEGEKRWKNGWDLRAGLGYDHAATPEAGDKPTADGFSAEAWNLRLTKDLRAAGRAYAAVSRRSRFPGLRELYSGALGRFVANPDLTPERQDLLEAGLEMDTGSWRLAGAAFLQNLHDGIEKISLPGEGRQFMRVNRTRIRVPGLELSGAWRARHDLEFSAQHTLMRAKVEEDGEFTRWAEDRPQYLGRLAADYHPYIGFGMLVEASFTGPRWSADATDEEDGLRRLPAGIVWNARLRYLWLRAGLEVEAHLRLDNLTDAWVDYQVGLPGPGRTFSGGVRISL
jgi:iron complex outermembrane receptor protein